MMAALPDGLPALGTVLDGKYRIDGVLGVGGMGAVLEAMHVALEEKVAIKVLLGDLAQDPEVVARFTREAWAAAKIKSENVARVHDVGALPSGAPYLVMEYLDGCDLEQLQQERGALPVAEVVDYILQACHALAEAHEQGIIHRDLKPGNLFRIVQPDGSPMIKVVDFGISKIGAAGDVTKTGTLMGSPVYMAPEQLVSSKDVDVTADIWSLGVILFELIAGRPPFDGETLPQLCTAVMSAPTPSLSQAADVPVELDAVIARCLDKDSEERFANLAELAGALVPFGGPKASRSAEYVARVLGKTTLKMGTPRVAAGVATVASSPLALPGAPSSPANVATVPGVAPTVLEAVAPPPARSGRTLVPFLGALAGLAIVLGAAILLVRAPAETGGEAPTGIASSSEPTRPSKEESATTPEPVVVAAEEGAGGSDGAGAAPTDSASAAPSVAVAPPIAAPPPVAPPFPSPAAPPPPPGDGWGKHGRSR